MVARMVLLRFWCPTWRHDDRQERFPSKVCARSGRRSGRVHRSVVVAGTALLQFSWPARRHVDCQDRVPSKANSWRPFFFFFLRRACVPRGFAMFRAWMKAMTRASILYAKCATNISNWFLVMMSEEYDERTARLVYCGEV